MFFFSHSCVGVEPKDLVVFVDVKSTCIDCEKNNSVYVGPLKISLLCLCYQVVGLINQS